MKTEQQVREWFEIWAESARVSDARSRGMVEGYLRAIATVLEDDDLRRRVPEILARCAE